MLQGEGRTDQNSRGVRKTTYHHSSILVSDVQTSYLRSRYIHYFLKLEAHHERLGLAISTFCPNDQLWACYVLLEIEETILGEHLVTASYGRRWAPCSLLEHYKLTASCGLSLLGVTFSLLKQ